MNLHARVVARDEHVGEMRSGRDSARDQAVEPRSGLAWHQSRADGLDEVRRRLCGRAGASSQCRIDGIARSVYTHPASRARPLGASVAASRMRVESKQRSKSSARRRASLRARGRARTPFQTVDGTLAGLRTASRSASSASKSQSGAERMRTVRGGFGLWERHGG